MPLLFVRIELEFRTKIPNNSDSQIFIPYLEWKRIGSQFGIIRLFEPIRNFPALINKK